jgi:3-deoxy-D-manno-octulosonic-acid transferase
LAYRLLIVLLLPVVFIYTLKRANQDADQRYFWQRFGWRIPVRKDQPVWLHCASVGEVNAARPLVFALLKAYPELSIVLTSVTPTAAKVVDNSFSDSVQHVYLPFDTRAAVRRFLRHIQPRVGLILETEIWPSLFAEARHQIIPLVMVNGRLTQKTLAAPRWARAFMREALQVVDMVLAKSNADGLAYQQMGVASSRVAVLGNIKFAAVNQVEANLPRLIVRDYWLAASTHDNEESLLGALVKDGVVGGELLVIAPRHPDRGPAIEAQLRKLNIRFVVRSRDEAIRDDTQVYLADTLGELSAFMQHAGFVFMGGTLVPVGGHNLLEPAALGKVIVCGPYLDNFKEEAALLRSVGALTEITDIDELVPIVKRWRSSRQQFSQQGREAANAVATQTNILERYMNLLSGFITPD